jgi:putative transposase
MIGRRYKAFYHGVLAEDRLRTGLLRECWSMPVGIPTATACGEETFSMTWTGHTPEQIFTNLRGADAMLAAGRSVAPVVQHLVGREPTFASGRNQYGGVKADETRRLKELEIENARLKKLVADEALAMATLKSANSQLA